MVHRNPLQLLVGVDVGAHRHSIAIGLSDGRLLQEFEVPHTPTGLREFFSRVDAAARRYEVPVAVAMEGYNGHARPLDGLIRARDWRLFNVNNLKLARFKEIFPAPAKSDRIDSRKTLELFQLRERLPLAGDVLQEVKATPKANHSLKRLSRRRRRLVDERVRLLNALQADLRAVCPGLVEITGDVGNLWFLNFLTCRKGLAKLLRLRRNSLLEIPAVGKAYADAIQAWQKTAFLSPDAELVGDMIQQDAARIRELGRQIKALDKQIAEIAAGSAIARLLASIPGFGATCSSELAGEIGTVARFRSEASLALYLGMAPLDKSSGRRQASKPPRQVNARAKAAMMTAVDRHRKQVPASQRYYQKRRAQGKTHNQAIRALGRHLCRVIFKMLTQERPYRIDP